MANKNTYLILKNTVSINLFEFNYKKRVNNISAIV